MRSVLCALAQTRPLAIDWRREQQQQQLSDARQWRVKRCAIDGGEEGGEQRMTSADFLHEVLCALICMARRGVDIKNKLKYKCLCSICGSLFNLISISVSDRYWDCTFLTEVANVINVVDEHSVIRVIVVVVKQRNARL